MIKPYLKRDNPRELLVFAAMLFIPGLLMVLQKSAVPLTRQLFTGAQFGFRRYIVGMSSTGAHIFGSVAITLSVFWWSCTFISDAPRLKEADVFVHQII